MFYIYIYISSTTKTFFQQFQHLQQFSKFGLTKQNQYKKFNNSNNQTWLISISFNAQRQSSFSPSLFTPHTSSSSHLRLSISSPSCSSVSLSFRTFSNMSMELRAVPHLFCSNSFGLQQGSKYTFTFCSRFLQNLL